MVGRRESVRDGKKKGVSEEKRPSAEEKDGR